ncbi:MAG: Cobalamin import ATP-binding protein BtuD [Candidatus Methanolliviera sp. GoM_oil]|nr:MAG: Cobalamin import ATP-binding protein BtuD [Candidatus Methanolliviera sp. GoM_oil]
MELVGILDLKDRKIDELSGGMRKKVSIARAMTQQPKILLLDEVIANLDIYNRIEIMDLVKKISKDQIVILAIHDLDLAAQYCSKLLLLKDGGSIAIGDPNRVINRESIKKAYGLDLEVTRNPVTKSLKIIPVRCGIRVHVICGGGSGSTLLDKLVRIGYNVTAGVLNVLDEDYETSRILGINIATESPFSQISEASYKKNVEMISESNAVILTDLFFGPGNLKNLEAVKMAIHHNKPVISIEGSKIEERDFSNENATMLYNKLRKKMLIVKDEDGAIEILKNVP